MGRLARNAWNVGRAFEMFGQILANEASKAIVSSEGVRERFAEIDHMRGTSFEHFMTELFKALAWPAEHRGRPGDGGADVLVRRRSGDMAVQCKWHGRGKRAGVEGVREVYAAQHRLGTPHALVVTNQFFTTAAKEEAALFHIELWNRDELSRRIAIAYTDVTPLKAWFRVVGRFALTLIVVLLGFLVGAACMLAAALLRK